MHRLLRMMFGVPKHKDHLIKLQADKGRPAFPSPANVALEGNLFERKRREMIEQDLEKARRHGSRHRKEIERSEFCGCFYCLSKFRAKLVERWLDDDTTAVCPKCGIDAVIGSASGVDIRKPFLLRMKRYWFGGVHDETK